MLRATCFTIMVLLATPFATVARASDATTDPDVASDEARPVPLENARPGELRAVPAPIAGKGEDAGEDV